MEKNTFGLEEIFEIFNNAASIAQRMFDVDFLFGLGIASHYFLEGKLSRPIDEVNLKSLEKEYKRFCELNVSNEQLRKGFQLAMLKGIKEKNDPYYEMTPDAVALFMSYLFNKVVDNKQSVSILDLAIGTGNLMTAILNHANKSIQATGVEVDETLLQFAYYNANFQEHPLELYHQDSLRHLLIDPVDVIVTDLPVGYYPLKLTEDFKLEASEGYSFIHHLLIEQALKYTVSGGYILLLVPNSLFLEDASGKLNEFIKEHTYIQGFLQLPFNLFQDINKAKSILILQKKGEGVVAPKETLLAQLPSFSNKHAMQAMMQKINHWFSTKKV